MFIICNKKKFPGFWLVQLDSRRRLWITTMPGSWNVKIPLFIQNNLKKYTEHFIRCVTPSTRTTVTTTEDCGHAFDCDAAGNGYFADPFNCRKYWHCYRFCEQRAFSDILLISPNLQRWHWRALSLPRRPSNWKTRGFRSRLHGLQLSGITRRKERRG